MSNKNTTIAVLLLLLLTTAACKDKFDIDSIDEQAKLVVYCFPSEADTTWIDVTYSVPVGKESAGRSIKGFMEVADAHIVYKVNGQERPVGWVDGAVDRWDHVASPGRYYVTGAHQPGDLVELNVSAPGYPSVQARTTVVPAVPVALKSVEETHVYDPDWADTRHVYQLSATFTDDAASDDYYAVRVSRRMWRLTAVGDMRPDYPNRDFYDEEDWHVEWPMSSVEEFLSVAGGGWADVYDFQLVRDSLIAMPEVLAMSEPLLQQISQTDTDFGFENDFYDQFYYFSDQQINGQTYTLHLNISYYQYNTSGVLQQSEDGPEDYRVQLYHLTPEFYHYLKSINDVDNNDLAQSGLSMLSPTFTNVQGGIGIVGGYSQSNSRWLQATDRE